VELQNAAYMKLACVFLLTTFTSLSVFFVQRLRKTLCTVTTCTRRRQEFWCTNFEVTVPFKIYNEHLDFISKHTRRWIVKLAQQNKKIVTSNFSLLLAENQSAMRKEREQRAQEKQQMLEMEEKEKKEGEELDAILTFTAAPPLRAQPQRIEVQHTSS
jgi:hypothetical protein